MIRDNDTYRCSNPKCGFEMRVVHAGQAAQSNQAPRCACGSEMKRA